MYGCPSNRASMGGEYMPRKILEWPTSGTTEIRYFKSACVASIRRTLQGYLAHKETPAPLGPF